MAVRKRSLFDYSVFQRLPGGLCDCGKCSRSEMLNLEKMRPHSPFQPNYNSNASCLY